MIEWLLFLALFACVRVCVRRLCCVCVCVHVRASPRLRWLNSVQQPFFFFCTPARSRTSACAPLGGTRLKQEADVTARRVNIGHIVRVCVCVHARAHVRAPVIVCRLYSWHPYCQSHETPLPHTLLSVFVACWILLISL